MEEDGSRDENVESAASPPSPGKRKASKACRFRAHTNCGPPWVSAHRIRLWPDGRAAQITSELIVLKAKTAFSTRSQLTRLNQFMRRTIFFLLKLNNLCYLATEKSVFCVLRQYWKIAKYVHTRTLNKIQNKTVWFWLCCIIIMVCLSGMRNSWNSLEVKIRIILISKKFIFSHAHWKEKNQI